MNTEENDDIELESKQPAIMTEVRNKQHETGNKLKTLPVQQRLPQH